MKYVSLLLCSLMFFCNLNAQGKKISIKGKILNATDKVIYLKDIVGNEYVTVDSILIKNNGKFKLEVIGKEPHFYSLYFDANKYLLLSIDSANTSKKLMVNANYDSFLPSVSISGSDECKSLASFSKYVSNHQSAKDTLMKKFYDKSSTPESHEKIRLELAENDKKLMTERDKFIEENYGKISSIVALSFLQVAQENDYQTFKKIENELAKTYPQTEYYKAIQAELIALDARRKQEEDAAKSKAQSEIGGQAPELNMQSPNGEVITLASLKGNYVLIDFWASWCGPCRKENPNVVRVYEKYKDKGFTVYSVSLDQTKDAWLKAIEKDGLVWPNHVSDLKGWKSAACPIYGFGSIPHTILIDPNGIIIAKNLRGPALDQKISELLDK